MWNKIKSQVLKSVAKILFSFSICLFTTSLAYAAIAVENRTGVISITTPDGNVVTVEASDPLPSISSGATIEVISGTADISATGSDTINVIVNDSTVTVDSGDSVSVTIGTGGTAVLDVKTGNVSVLKADGTTQEVTAGGTVAMQAQTPVSTEEGINIPALNPANDSQTLAKGY